MGFYLRPGVDKLTTGGVHQIWQCVWYAGKPFRPGLLIYFGFSDRIHLNSPEIEHLFLFFII